MLCTFCNSDIEDDSFYCDQCGREILICPKCGKLGTKKVCTSDGTKLITAKERQAPHTDTVTTDQHPVPTEAQQQPPFPQPPVSHSNQIPKLRLINKNLGLDIKIEDGDLIGHKTGRLVNIFGNYKQVSGRHLQINYAIQKGWLVTDLGSTNGTKLNKTPLTPHQPVILTDSSILTIANIEFYVQIEATKEESKTGTRML